MKVSLAGNPGKKNIRFRSGMVTGFPPGDTHVGFEMVNAPFHDCFDFIKGNPFIRIQLNLSFNSIAYPCGKQLLRKQIFVLICTMSRHREYHST